MKRRAIMMSIALISSLMLAALSPAADYPAKTVTIINPNAPGGGHDVAARAFASVAEKVVGQSVVVVNKAGASTMLGMTAVAQSAPDGYTLGMDSTTTTNALAWEIVNGRKPPITREDLLPVGGLSVNVPLVIVPYNSPWKTMTDMARDLKAKPGQYAFCSGGLYGGTHLPAEVLLLAIGTKARHVPHKGGGPCLAAVVGEHVHFATQWAGTSIPLAQGKKVRILAVQGDERMKSIPDVPTIREGGVDAEWIQWLGMSIPRKTPAPLAGQVKAMVKKVAQDPGFNKILESQGAEARYLSSDEVEKFIRDETDVVGKIYKTLLAEDKGRK
ncbi:MAG: tripartite tricarboxylate transporter substrate binding protein [Thermodesulfobacteriota bacterium]